MELKSIKEKALPVIKKYRYFLIILLAGILLMSFPSKKQGQEQDIPVPIDRAQEEDMEERLTRILKKIDGAGDVEVLLTEEAGERTIYQMDNVGENERQDTVVVTGADRGQYGLVQQRRSPEYRGAVVVCQGASDPKVRLAIVEAVSRATALGADRISVWKMK